MTYFQTTLTTLATFAASVLFASLGTSAAMAQTGVTPRAMGLLGTLILSPSQRRDLEALRPAPDSAHDSARAAVPPSTAPDQGLQTMDSPSAEAINGVVIRSGNRSTVWVDGQPHYGRATADPLRALNGQASESLPPGAIRIIPPKAGVTANQESRK
jgi:hypothetical protein